MKDTKKVRKSWNIDRCQLEMQVHRNADGVGAVTCMSAVMDLSCIVDWKQKVLRPADTRHSGYYCLHKFTCANLNTTQHERCAHGKRVGVSHSRESTLDPSCTVDEAATLGLRAARTVQVTGSRERELHETMAFEETIQNMTQSSMIQAIEP